MNIKNILKLACKGRPGFSDAIGFFEATVAEDNRIPDCLSEIYRNASGTYASITNQKLMDLVPGYRLIHREELQKEIANFQKTYEDLQDFVPFLADYASSYIAINMKNNSVYSVTLDYEETQLSVSLDDYMQTIEACYTKGTYFIDSDGFLDCDFDAYYKIGEQVNPTCSYWNE